MVNDIEIEWIQNSSEPNFQIQGNEQKMCFYKQYVLLEISPVLTAILCANKNPCSYVFSTKQIIKCGVPLKDTLKTSMDVKDAALQIVDFQFTKRKLLNRHISATVIKNLN